MESTNDNKVKVLEGEPLFRVVIPKRRTWFYRFIYSIRGSKFFEAIFGPQQKALPAPVRYMSN